MPYPKDLLNDHETVALDLHPHWSYFVKPAIALVIAAIAGILVQVWFDGNVEKVLTWICIAAIIISAIWVVRRYAQWSTTNFVITSDRVIFRSGVISKSGIEIPLRRVNNVLFKQGVFERMIGTGDLMIESGGETGQQRFTDVRNPSHVKNLIYAQMQHDNDEGSGSSAVADVPSQLEKLEGLLERGTLSQEQFDEQKRRLLEG